MHGTFLVMSKLNDVIEYCFNIKHAN